MDLQQNPRKSSAIRPDPQDASRANSSISSTHPSTPLSTSSIQRHSAPWSQSPKHEEPESKHIEEHQIGKNEKSGAEGVLPSVPKPWPPHPSLSVDKSEVARTDEVEECRSDPSAPTTPVIQLPSVSSISQGVEISQIPGFSHASELRGLRNQMTKMDVLDIDFSRPPGPGPDSTA